jgi:hypothetical protein
LTIANSAATKKPLRTTRRRVTITSIVIMGLPNTKVLRNSRVTFLIFRAGFLLLKTLISFEHGTTLNLCF